MARSDPHPPATTSRYELLTLPLPFLLWFYTFGSLPPDFWVKLALSGALLLAVALRRRRQMSAKFSLTGLAAGILSGVLLYLFFWTGYHVMSAVPGFLATVSSVYAYAGSTPKLAIAALLLFPIGPAEEVYWRGLVQRYLGGKMSQRAAVLLTSVLYTSIHIVTLNPSLLLVALVGGIVWGSIYARFKDLFPALVSHILFDELIFVFLMIG